MISKPLEEKITRVRTRTERLFILWIALFGTVIVLGILSNNVNRRLDRVERLCVSTLTSSTSTTAP